jgi:hypothetical protein
MSEAFSGGVIDDTSEADEIGLNPFSVNRNARIQARVSHSKSPFVRNTVRLFKLRRRGRILVYKF